VSALSHAQDCLPAGCTPKPCSPAHTLVGNRANPSWICDVDRLLSTKGANIIEGVIKLINTGESPYVKRKCGSTGVVTGYEARGNFVLMLRPTCTAFTCFR